MAIALSRAALLGPLVRFGDEMLAFLFAAECAVCGRIGAGEKGIAAVCETCRELLPLGEVLCFRCGCATTAPIGECGQCQQEAASPLQWSRSSYWLDERAQALWHTVKFRKREEILYHWQESFPLALPPIQEPWTVVPVPLPWDRLLSRGRNHAEWIARRLADTYRWPCHPYALSRAVGSPQSLMKARERRRNVRGKFRWRGGPPPAAILLVDDIYTTGATLRECARVVREAGAQRVAAVTLFRTPRMAWKERGPVV